MKGCEPMRVRSSIVLVYLVAACGGDGEATNDTATHSDADAVTDATGDAEIADSTDTGTSPDDGIDVGSDEHDVGSETGVGDDVDLDTDVDSDTDAVIDSDTSDGLDVTSTPWRSALYPEDWTPATTHASGAFLHDFSWAGYHHGERELGAGLGEQGLDGLARFDVTAYGATPVALDAPGEALDATAAFQAAIDAASGAGGGHVFAPAGLYRIDGQLRIQASRVVLGGEGADRTRLWMTKLDGMSYAAHIRFAGASQVIATSLLTADAHAREHVVRVADASLFMVGDDVRLGQVITDAFVAEHGMTGTWRAFNGAWQPFFHRTVTAVDAEAGTVTLDVPLRYPMKVVHGASLERVTGLLREVGLHDLGVANAVGWEAAWATNQVHALALEHVADAWVRGVASFPSPGAPTRGSGPAPTSSRAASSSSCPSG